MFSGPQNYGIMCAVKKILTAMLFTACAYAACAADSSAEEDTAGDGWYAGASGGVILPGGGNSLRRAAGAGLRCGRYFTDYVALELEGFSVPSAVCDHGGNAAVFGALMQGVFHFSGWDEFDMLFGCERFDPFLALGAGACFADRHVFADDSHRTALGPVFGLGAFYHLTDSVSLRADARAQLCCDSPCGMLYGVSLGLQYSFGGCE